MKPDQATRFLKDKAIELGFLDVGIARVEPLDAERDRLNEWLNKGYQGTMSYMENHLEKRLDVGKLVPGAKSVVVLLYNYYPDTQLSTEGNYKISRYAYGRDYHKVIRKKLKNLFAELNENIGMISGRYFVDSAPVMERVWANKAGLGWIGKNTLLLNKEKGSYFFIAEMILDITLEYDNPVMDHCGTCTACLDACPTDALSQYQLDSNKCISYLTIEHKGEIDSSFEGKTKDWIFGCDICQEVCPWNRFSKTHSEPEFNPSIALNDMNKEEWESLDEDKFEQLFKGSAVKRTGFEGLKRNIRFSRS